MKMKMNDDILLGDLSLVASSLNQNSLSEEEYLAGGGKFSLDCYFERYGSFIGALQMCGLRYTM